MNLRRGAPRRFLLTAGMVVLSLCAAHAYEFPSSEGGIPLRWAPSPNPIPYYIDRRAVEGFADGNDVEAIQSAFEAWEQVATADVRFRYAGLAGEDGVDPNASVVVWLKDDWPHDSRYVAKTRLYYRPDEGVIVRAEIYLNGRDYRWSADGKAGTLDIRNAATHEVGHFLGLGDVRTAGQTMFEYIRLEEREKGVLSDDELEGLRAAYPRLSPDDELLVATLSLDYGEGALRPAGYGPPLPGGESFAALCPLPGSVPGVVRASDGAFSLLLPHEDGSTAHEIPILAGDLNPGRVRAVASLPPASPGGDATLAALIGSPDGTALALGPVPSPPDGTRVIRMTLRPLGGADDVISFAHLGSAEAGFEDALAVIEKRRGSEFHLSIVRLLPDGEPDGGLVLTPVRSWMIPDCAGASGLTVIEGNAGLREIAALVRGGNGDLEMVSYASPFAYLPSDGSPLEPSSRVDASALRDAGDPLGIAGLPPAGSGRRRIAALLAR